MKKVSIITLLILSIYSCFSQKIARTAAEISTEAAKFDAIHDNLKNNTLETNLSKNLLTGRAFNLFIQKKAFSYLTGSSEVTLSDFYGTYTSESDKLTLGFNLPWVRKKDGKLRHLFNPMFETNIKNNFATLRKKGEWQSDIRAGLKYTWIIPGLSSVNYYPWWSKGETKKQILAQQSRMIIKRNEITQSLLDKIKKEKEKYLASNSLDNETLYSKEYELKIEKENLEQQLCLQRGASKKSIQRIKEIMAEIDDIDELIASLPNLNGKEIIDAEKKQLEYEKDLAKQEVDALAGKGKYAWMQTGWLSVWGFYPVTKRDYYVTPTASELFDTVKFSTWEVNAQFNYLIENSKIGSAFFTAGYRLFQNNTAIAELLTAVDYNDYLNLPGVDGERAAITKTGKAFIGIYDEFVTENWNVQIVLMLTSAKNDKAEQKEKLITPGISFRYEKNYGDYKAVNIRLGFPLRFRGKDKAINIEPQFRWNDYNNYTNKTDFKRQANFGINVGLPFVALFK